MTLPNLTETQRRERAFRKILFSCPDALIPGDVVCDRDGLTGVVLVIRSLGDDPWSTDANTFASPDWNGLVIPPMFGNCEVRLRVLDGDPTLPHYARLPSLRRVSPRDPYRRFCRVVQAADSRTRQALRAYRRIDRQVHRHIGGTYWRCQHLLPEQVWDRLYWQLSNRKRNVDVHGRHRTLWADLGRDHWDAAATECLRRRDDTRAQIDALL